MDTKLNNGGFVLNSRGLPYAVLDAEELAQRAYIRLAVRRGSFALDPQLGSDLHRLPRGTAEALAPLAADYVRQALAPLPAVTVQEVGCRYDSAADAITATVTLRIDRQLYEMEVTA